MLKTNSNITIDYIKNTKEHLYYDRKSSKISSQHLANEIASFANNINEHFIKNIDGRGVKKYGSFSRCWFT